MSMDLIFSKIKQLPVIPKLLHELMQDFSSDNSRIEDIAKKIAMDQVISAKVLKMANSAAYRRGQDDQANRRNQTGNTEPALENLVHVQLQIRFVLDNLPLCS